MDTRRQDDASTAFGDLGRDVHGVPPVELQRFVRNRLSASDAGEVFDAVLRGGVSREQLAGRLGLSPDAITDFDFKRLRHLLSLWYRWAADDAEGWIISGGSREGGDR